MSRRATMRQKSAASSGVDRVVVHDVERIALLAHVQPGERAPGAADRVERPLLALGEHRRNWRAPRRRSSPPSSATSPTPPRAAGRRAERSRRRRSRALRISTTSRLPPPRSPATPSGSWKPEMTPSAVRRASSAPDRTATWTPVIASTAAMNSRPFEASRGAAVASTCSDGDVHLRRQRAEAADRRQRRGDRLGLEPAARRQAAGEAAELLLVEQRRRRARQPLVDDETDRVRADVDDGDRAAAVRAGPARLRSGHGHVRSRSWHACGAAWANRS